jgi:uncharacterized protein YecA (UPF0149 family)
MAITVAFRTTRGDSNEAERSHLMGAIADAFAAYAQPLFEQTDGSIEQVNRAIALAQMCYNLAMLPEDQREAAIAEMKPAMNMSEEDFDELRRTIILPMIRRHHDMFPRMHGRSEPTSDLLDFMLSSGKSDAPPSPKRETSPSPKQSPAAGRNDPCPCGSGHKYKRCCGAAR